MLSGGIFCSWFGFCGETTTEEEYLRLDRELIETRRKFVSPPPENVDLDDYYEALEEKSEELTERLNDLEFKGRKFPIDSQVYRQSLWKYLELFGQYASDKLITNEEAKNLYDIAFDSKEIGIKFLFRRFITQQSIYYRWGGFDDEECLDDRNTTYFANDAGFINDAGGLVLVFSNSEQMLHTNEPGMFNYGYDPKEEVREQPLNIKWNDEDLRNEYVKASSSWILSERPRNMMSMISGDSRNFHFENASGKRAIVLRSMQTIRENIDNVTLFEQEVEFLMSIFFHPKAVQMLIAVLVMNVLGAETIDMGMKHYYVSVITKAYKQYLENMNQFSRELNHVNEFDKENVIQDTAFAIRQDVVTTFALIQEYTIPASVNACSDMLSGCEHFIQNSQSLPNSFLAKTVSRNVIAEYEINSHEGINAIAFMLEKWEREGVNDRIDNYKIDQMIIRQFDPSADTCDIDCMQQAKTFGLLKMATNITTPGFKRPVTVYENNIVTAAIFLGMFGEGWLASDGGMLSGLKGIFGSFKTIGQWLGISAIFFAFLQPTYAGFSMYSASADDVSASMDAVVPFNTTFDENANCECHFEGD